MSLNCDLFRIGLSPLRPFFFLVQPFGYEAREQGLVSDTLAVGQRSQTLENIGVEAGQDGLGSPLAARLPALLAELLARRQSSDHGQMDNQWAGDGYFGKTATVDQTTEALRWFNRYLMAGGHKSHAVSPLDTFLTSSLASEHANLVASVTVLSPQWQRITHMERDRIQVILVLALR